MEIIKLLLKSSFIGIVCLGIFLLSFSQKLLYRKNEKQLFKRIEEDYDLVRRLRNENI